jgi:HEAT repeat protein
MMEAADGDLSPSSTGFAGPVRSFSATPPLLSMLIGNEKINSRQRVFEILLRRELERQVFLLCRALIPDFPL